MIVRDATEADVPAIRAIADALLATTTVTWADVPDTLRQRRAWFARQRRDGHPVLVADDGGAVAGFATYESFRGAGKWPGYRYTVEHSIHVARSHWGAGTGRALLDALVDRAREAGLHVMVGAVDADNAASLRFHERLGFTEVARMHQVGRKFDRWLDLVLVQRILDPAA